MGALSVIESKIAAEFYPGISAILICFQIHFFVFHCSPQPLDKQVVIITSLPIHADPDSVLFQYPGESPTSELTALVGIEYLRFALLESFLQSLDAEISVQGV